MPPVGLLLAAGAGVRFGGPKALATDPDGTSWLVRSVDVLSDAGCAALTVVLGAGADRARPLLAGRRAVEVVVCPEWAEGMGASLRTGLAALEHAPAQVTAALVHLVDLPDVGSAVAARVLDSGAGAADLARASYDGRPGHPVLLGRDHWSPVARTAAGDQGARAYLARHPHRLVECGDLAGGQDQDTPVRPTPPGSAQP